MSSTKSYVKPDAGTRGHSEECSGDWQGLPAASFYGSAGDLVRAIEPHSEADPAAVLVQLLTAFGNLIGRRPHFIADGARHSLNLFAVLVGLTSKGRKGTAWARVKSIVECVDSNWTTNRVQSGLSSGEGLIWAIRDPLILEDEKEQKGKVIAIERMVDPGIADKRLLVLESEFASVLKMCGRDGNVLSPILRQAWDGQNLQVLTKHCPTKATNPHVSVVGHVTKQELLRHLNATEQASGFANRFLWVLVRRSKFLPDGGNLDLDSVIALDFFTLAADQARKVGEIKRDAQAADLWRSVYRELSGGGVGLHGAVTARAEAQTMRIACLYALIDESVVVQRKHLEAALALWGYCDMSAKHIFGDALGDPTADEILRVLRQKGSLTRTQISDLFQRNKASVEIERALGLLREQRLAQYAQEDSGGRPVERWTAVENAASGPAARDSSFRSSNSYGGAGSAPSQHPGDNPEPNRSESGQPTTNYAN